MATMWNGLGEPVQLNRYPEKIETPLDAAEYLRAKFYPNSLGHGKYLDEIICFLHNYSPPAPWEEILRSDPTFFGRLYEDFAGCQMAITFFNSGAPLVVRLESVEVR